MARTAEAQRSYRSRKNLEMLDILLEDVHIYVGEQDGQQIIRVDMGDDTRQAMELLSEAMGKSLRQLIGECLSRVLKKADALRRVAEREQNQGRIAELEAELARTDAELANLRARKRE